MIDYINATKRKRSDPFKPRWRLRVIPASVAISLSFWFMIVGIIG
jgi:hypothetical protein